MIKKKSKMNKIIMWGLIATASVSLASVGFANWVINTMAPAQSGDITIGIGAVKTKSISTELTLTDGTVKFDHDDKGKNFTNDDNGVEDLKFIIKSKFTCADSNQKIGSILKGVKFDFDFSTELAALFGKTDANKYIEAPFVADSATNSSSLKLTFDETTYAYKSVTGEISNYLETGLTDGAPGNTSTFEFSTTFTFRWGLAFGNTNPASTDVNAALTKDELINRLNAFKTATAGKTLNLNVTVTPLDK